MSSHSYNDEEDEAFKDVSPFLRDVIKNQKKKQGTSKTEKLLERHPSIGESIELLHMFSDDQYYQQNFEEVRHRLKKKINGYQTQINLLRGQLKRREKSINEQRAKYTKELIVLREELFRKENFEGYKPQDYRFSDYEHPPVSSDKAAKGSPGGGGYRTQLELQGDFEIQRKRFFKQKKDILKDITDKNEKVTQTLEKLRNLEDIKLKEVDVLRNREDQVKKMKDALKKKREALNEQMKMLQKRMKQIETERSGKEEQFKIKHLKGIIDRQEQRLDNLKTEIKSARTTHRYFEEKGARKRIENKRAELELQEKEKMRTQLEEESKDLEQNVLQKKAEMKKIATESRISVDLLRNIVGGNDGMGKSREEEETGEQTKQEEEEDSEVMTEEKKEDFFNDLFDKRKKESESEMKVISKEISSFKTEFTNMYQEIESMQKRMNFYKEDLEKKTAGSEGRAKIVGGEMERSMTGITELWNGPEGNMAIVFTDVEGSSSMWDADCDLMQKCMKIHNRLMRRLIRECGGYEVKTEGDAFMVAFKDSTSAVKFAVSVQSRLMVTNWPTELYQFQSGKIEKSDSGSTIFRGMRVRIGINVGEPIVEDDDITGRRDYFGPVVIKASRLETFSRTGGHIIVSQEVFSEIADIVGKNRKEKKFFTSRLFVKDLGITKLKGLKEDRRVYVIYPWSLRKRMLKFESSETPVTDPSLQTKLGMLLTKKQDLECRREGIEKQMVNQVRIKGMEQEVMEKDGLIKYLKDKIKNMEEQKQETDEKVMKSPSSAENLKKVHDEKSKIIREDVDEIMDRYYVMMREYRTLKTNFNSVIKMFNTDVKLELGKDEKTINKMKSNLAQKIEENTSKEKLWKLKKKEFELIHQKQEEIIQDKKDQIVKLRKQIDDLISIPTELPMLFKGDGSEKELRKDQEELSREKMRVQMMRDKMIRREEELRRKKIEQMNKKARKAKEEADRRVERKQKEMMKEKHDAVMKKAKEKAAAIELKSFKGLERIRKMKEQGKKSIDKLKKDAKKQIDFMRSSSLTDLVARESEFTQRVQKMEEGNMELEAAKRRIQQMERRLKKNIQIQGDEEHIKKNIEKRRDEFEEVTKDVLELRKQRNKLQLMLEIENEKLESSKKGDRASTPEETIRLRKRLNELEKKVLEKEIVYVSDPLSSREKERDGDGEDNEESDDEGGYSRHTPFPKRKKTKKRAMFSSIEEENTKEKSAGDDIENIQQKRMEDIIKLQDALHKKAQRMENMIEECEKEKDAANKVESINSQLREQKEVLETERNSMERKLDKISNILIQTKRQQRELRKERKELEDRIQRFKVVTPPESTKSTDETTEGEKDGEKEGEGEKSTEEEGQQKGKDDGKPPKTPPLSIGRVIYKEDGEDDKEGEDGNIPSLSDQLILRNKEHENQKMIRKIEDEMANMKKSLKEFREKNNMLDDQIERGEIRKEELVLQKNRKEVEIKELKTMTENLQKKLREKKMKVQSIEGISDLSYYSKDSREEYEEEELFKTTTEEEDNDKEGQKTSIPIISVSTDPTKSYSDEEDVRLSSEEEDDDNLLKHRKKIRKISSSHALQMDEKELEEFREELREQELALKQRATSFGKKIEQKMEEKIKTELQSQLERELIRREEELKVLRQQHSESKAKEKVLDMSLFLEKAITEAVKSKNKLEKQTKWDEDDMIIDTEDENSSMFIKRFKNPTEDDISEVEKMIKEEEERDAKRKLLQSTTEDDSEEEEEEEEGEYEELDGWSTDERPRKNKKKRRRKTKKKEGQDVQEMTQTEDIQTQTSVPSTPMNESIVLPGYTDMTWNDLNQSMDTQIRDLKTHIETLSKGAFNRVRDGYVSEVTSPSTRRRKRVTKRKKRRVGGTDDNLQSTIVGEKDDAYDDDLKLIRNYQRERKQKLKQLSRYEKLPSIYEEQQSYMRKLTFLMKKKQELHDIQKKKDEQKRLQFLQLQKKRKKKKLDLQQQQQQRRHPHKVFKGYSRVLESTNVSELRESFRNKSSTSPFMKKKSNGFMVNSPQKGNASLRLPRINQLQDTINRNRVLKKKKKKNRGDRGIRNPSTTSSRRRVKKFKKWNSLVLDEQFVDEKNALLDELYYKRNATMYKHVDYQK